MRFSAPLLVSAGLLLSLAPLADANALNGAMANALLTQATQIAQSMPAGVLCATGGSCLITSMQATGQLRVQVGNPNQFPELVVAWSLPPDVAGRLQMALLAESSTFEVFQVTVNANAGTGSLTEYIGAVRRFNGVAEVGLVDVRASAALQTQYDAIGVRYCKSKIFGKCINHGTRTEYHVRGFTAAELNLIVQGMRASAYEKVLEIIAQAPRAFMAAPFALASEPSADRLHVSPPAPIVAGPAFAALSSAITSEAVLGAAELSSTAARSDAAVQVAPLLQSGAARDVFVQRLRAIPAEQLPILAARLVLSLRAPARYQERLLDVLSDVRRSQGLHDWLKWDMLYECAAGAEQSPRPAGACFASIIGSRDAATNTTSWLVTRSEQPLPVRPPAAMAVRLSESLGGGRFEGSAKLVASAAQGLGEVDLEGLFSVFELATLRPAGAALGLDATPLA